MVLEKILESPLDSREIKPVNPKGMRRADSFEKTLMLGKIEGEEGGLTEDKMVGWHHRLNGHEFE